MGEFTALFTRAAKLMRSAAELSLQKHGVHLGQNLLLLALEEHDGSTPGELARRLRVATPTVVKMVDRMERANLVERRRNDEDGRLVRLYLTRRSRRLVEPIREEEDKLERQATAGLSATELRDLEHTLRKVINNLEAATTDVDS